MASKKLTKADLKRMETLSAKNAQAKKEIETEKVKLKKIKKELDAEKKKLAGQWKELKNQKKQQQIEKNFKAGVESKSAKKSARGGDGGSNKKLQKDLLEMKTKYNFEGKRARQFKQQVDQLTAEKKVLEKKLKNLQGRKEKGEDPRIRNLQRENKQLKKQIKMLMIELNKKRRWFQRCIKSFRSSRQKWIKKQEDTLKKKGFLIKYVFLDDVKQIKAYKDKGAKGKNTKGKKRFKNKIKVKNRDGGVIVLKDVEIVILDNDDDDDGNNGKKKGKKGKKSKGDQLDEMDAFLDELQAEIEADQEAIGGDEYKDIDSDDDDFNMDEDVGDLDGDYSMNQLMEDTSKDAEDDDDDEQANGDNNNNGSKTPKGGNKTPKSGKKSSKKGDLLGLPAQHSIDTSDNAALSAQLVYLMKELDDRTDDVEKMKEIVSDSEAHPDPVKEVKNYTLNIQKRGEEMLDKLENELHADDGEIEQMKANNDRWLLWLNNLSATMANNGALFNELLAVFECYLKELKARVKDVNVVNNTIYVDKENENKEEEEENDGEEFDGLKKKINERHNETEEEFEKIEKKKENDDEEEDEDYGENKEKEILSANAEKVKEIRSGLVGNNKEWRELMESVANDYDLSTKEKNKLVENINETNNELKALMDLVQKIPKRKILQNDEENQDNEQQQEEDDDNNDDDDGGDDD